MSALNPGDALTKKHEHDPLLEQPSSFGVVNHFLAAALPVHNTPGSDSLMFQREETLKVLSACQAILPALKLCHRSNVPELLSEKLSFLGVVLKSALYCVGQLGRKTSENTSSGLWQEAFEHYRAQHDDQKFKMLCIVTNVLMRNFDEGAFDPEKPLSLAFKEIREKLCALLNPDNVMQVASKIFNVKFLGKQNDYSLELQTPRGFAFIEFKNVWDDALFSLQAGLKLVQLKIPLLKLEDLRDTFEADIAQALEDIAPLTQIRFDEDRIEALLVGFSKGNGSAKPLSVEDLQCLFAAVPSGEDLIKLNIANLTARIDRIEKSLFTFIYGDSRA